RRSPSAVYLCSCTAPTPLRAIPLSLHDALPIFLPCDARLRALVGGALTSLNVRLARKALRELPAGELSLPRLRARRTLSEVSAPDRKSTRLNSSHLGISYAVFCLKKKKHLILCH